MKRTLTALVAVAVAVSANAFINVNLDDPNQVVNSPAAGTVTLTFTGTVDVENGFDVTVAELDFPGLTLGGPFLTAAFDAGFVAYVGGASPDVDYAGTLFTVDVDSSDAEGLYYLNSFFGDDGAELIVSASDGTNTFADNEYYSVNVVPEPASIALLGLGAAALIRKRR